MKSLRYLVLFLLFALSACMFNFDSDIPVSGVSINKAATTLLVDASELLFAMVTPSNATNQDIVWTSTASTVARVSAAGLVTGVADGTATISATTVDGLFTATCAVTVASTAVPVTGLSMNKAATSVLVGNTEQLTVTISPANATNQNITWTSTADAIASVSNSGLVTGVAAGAATITATSVNGGFKANCLVTVSAVVVQVTGITMNVSALAIEEGNAEQLYATINPAAATNQKVMWTSSNSAFVTVSSSGYVTASTPGSARITVTTDDGGYSAYCDVTVVANMPPSVVIMRAAGQPNPTNRVEFTFIVTFSEPVFGFETGDLDYNGFFINNENTSITPIDSRSYEVLITGTAAPNGVLTVTIPGGRVQDARTWGNTASTGTDNMIAYDSTVPNISAFVLSNACDSGLSTNDRITNFTMLDFVGFSTEGGRLVIESDVDGTLYDAPTAINWSPSVFIASHGGQAGTMHNISAQITDSAGNASGWTTIQVTVDTTAPAPVITTANTTVTSQPINFTVDFGETVTNFTSASVSLSSTGSPTMALTPAGASASYNLAVWGLSSGNSVTPSITTPVGQDAAGNFSPAAGGPTVTYIGP